MRILGTDLNNFQAGNITAYITFYRNIKKRKDRDEDPIFKMYYPFVKRKKWPHFSKIVLKWMSTQFIVNQITPLVNLVREEDTILSYRNMKILSRLDEIFFRKTLSEEEQQEDNAILLTVIHKMTIGVRPVINPSR